MGGYQVKNVPLEISQEIDGTWIGIAQIGTANDPHSYSVFGNTLQEVRDLVAEVEAGALGIPNINFTEVFINDRVDGSVAL